MKTILLSLSLFTLVAVPFALAGGDPDQIGGAMYDSNGNPIVSATGTNATSTAAGSLSASSTDQVAAVGSTSLIWQVILVVLIIAAGAALIAWGVKRNKI